MQKIARFELFKQVFHMGFQARFTVGCSNGTGYHGSQSKQTSGTVNNRRVSEGIPLPEAVCVCGVCAGHVT